MKAFRRKVIGAFCLGGICLLAMGAPDPAAPPVPDGQIQPPVQPAEGVQVAAPAPAVPQKPQQLSDMLVWNGDVQEFVAAKGEVEVHFTFSLTNISQQSITIMRVTTSCGCTTAHLPPMPWVMAPGTNGEIAVTMNLAGKMGVVIKTVTVSTDKGTKILRVQTTILPATPGSAPMGGREQNQKMALADRQAVFKGDCARCHVEPGVGKMGKELYLAVCGICHEAEHRATMVPDLHNLNHETSRELWNVWIAFGKPGSLMPAFAESQGGPLSDAQIRSLVDYLAEAIPNRPAASPPAPVVK